VTPCTLQVTLVTMKALSCISTPPMRVFFWLALSNPAQQAVTRHPLCS
jgi:hypothetical protein